MIEDYDLLEIEQMVSELKSQRAEIDRLMAENKALEMMEGGK